MTDDLAALDATAQAALVRDGSATPRELVDAALARIGTVNGELGLVILATTTVLPRRSRRRSARRPVPGRPDPGRGPRCSSLAGRPLHLGNHRLLRDHRPRRRSRLVPVRPPLTTSCVIVGKTNTPELGLLPTTESHAATPAHSPWDLPARSPGGSSGGKQRRWRRAWSPFALARATAAFVHIHANDDARLYRAQAHSGPNLARSRRRRGLGRPRHLPSRRDALWCATALQGPRRAR